MPRATCGTMAAIVVREVGGIGKLVLDRARPIPVPRAHEVLVRNAFAGLRHDTYCRSGLYPLLGGDCGDGFVVGCEGGGVVVALGRDVTQTTGIRAGDRVAYLQEGVHGTYSGHCTPNSPRCLPAG